MEFIASIFALDTLYFLSVNGLYFVNVGNTCWQSLIVEYQGSKLCLVSHKSIVNRYQAFDSFHFKLL